MTASAPAASPAPRRDLVTALLICAGIGAALAIGYRAPDPVAEQAAAEQAATALAAAALASTATSAAPGGGEPVNAAFNLDTAMRLAGTRVPAELDSFYFFAMIDEAPELVDVAELGDKLAQAAAEHDYLGVAGPDPERNRRTLLAALAARKATDLKALKLIYLGPDSHRAEISAAAQAAGFELHFLSYPAADDGSATAPAATPAEPSPAAAIAAPKAPI